MNDMMKQVQCWVIQAYRPFLWLCIMLCAGYAAISQQAVNLFHPVTGLKNVLQSAVAGQKTALVYLTAKWCGPCRELEEQALVDSGIVRTLQTDFFPVKWDIDSMPEAKALQKKYFTGVPAFFAFDSIGNMQYYFVGYSNKKAFARSLQYALQPETDPVFIMKKKYVSGNDISQQFRITYTWALLKQGEHQASAEVFRELWDKAGAKERLQDSIALYLLHHTDRREPLYSNAVKKNATVYSRLTSKSTVASYLTTPLLLRLDSIVDRQRDTTGFFKTWQQYYRQLQQYEADSADIQYAGLYPLQFSIVYRQKDMDTKLEQAFDSAFKKGPSASYQFITYIFMWYRKEGYAFLREDRPALINRIGKAAATDDKYLYNYFLAELYYDGKDKPNALKYGNKALERSAIEYPNKKPIASQALLEKINALQ